MDRESQADIFNIFHDGEITLLIRSDEDVKFIIDIQYLANLINPSYSSFQGVLVDCKEVFAHVLGENFYIIKELNILSTAEIEVLTAKSFEDRIEIFCASTKLGQGFGVILTIVAENIDIYDESGKKISLDEIDEVCNKYWNK